jgi:hypothetical protein
MSDVTGHVVKHAELVQDNLLSTCFTFQVIAKFEAKELVVPTFSILLSS